MSTDLNCKLIAICIIQVFTGRYFQTDIKFSWGCDVLNLFIFCIGKLSYIKSVRMSSGFIKIMKPLQNITEGCVSSIQYTPLKKKTIKNLHYCMFVNTNKLEHGARAFFIRSKHVLFRENVSLGLFLICYYETWFIRV